MEPTVGLKKSNTTSAKIVSTPSLVSWSQAYHAGNLFSVLSLSQKDSAVELNSLGKEVLDTLEQEFFTLETKDLESIKQAVLTTLQKIPEQVSASLVVTAIQSKDETVLYAYGSGNARILLKRGDTLGTVLPYTSELTASSGFLQDNDIIILETEKFAEIVPNDTLLSVLDNALLDVAEILSPKVQDASKGEATSLFVLFKKPVEENETASVEPPSASADLSTQPSLSPTRSTTNFSFLREFFRAKRASLTHSKKLFLTIAIIIGIVLISSIFFALKSQENKKTQALFQDMYPKASQKYEQGQSLLGLNKNLARDDFEEAKKILIEGKPKFKQGSQEEKQISELFAKVNNALESASESKTVQPKQQDTKVSTFLNTQIKHPTDSFFTQDSTAVYFVNEKNIVSVDKKSEASKNIIKNNGYWSKPGGIGTYLGNIYLLDKTARQILKFAVGDFTKTNYLSLGNSELENASALTIDGSIYVLLDSGDIRKFTKGQTDKFIISDLDKPFSKPTRIFTDTDTTNIYVLDNGNSRIVVLSKEGGYVSQYQATILKSSRDFEIREKDKKIYVLNQQKIWEIPM